MHRWTGGKMMDNGQQAITKVHLSVKVCPSKYYQRDDYTIIYVDP